MEELRAQIQKSSKYNTLSMLLAVCLVFIAHGTTPLVDTAFLLSFCVVVAIVIAVFFMGAQMMWGISEMAMMISCLTQSFAV
jgi:hypothetical protein